MDDKDENYYKREEDQKWRIKVDHELVTLMTGHQVLDRRMEEIEESIKEMDSILRGDPKKDLDGLVYQIHELQTLVAKLNAVIFVDSTGRKGLQHDVETIINGERRSDTRWKSYTTILVAIIGTISVLIANWNKIEMFFGKNTDPVDRAISRARGPKKRITHVRYRVIQAEPTDEGMDEPKDE